MNPIVKRFKNTIALAAIIVLAALPMMAFGVTQNTFASFIAVVGLWQLSQFAMSKRSARCFVAAFTDAQMREFEGIMAEFKEHSIDLKAMREIVKEFPDLKGTLQKLRRTILTGGGTAGGIKWINNVPFVTEDCAKHFASVLVLDCARLGDKALRTLNPHTSAHPGLISYACQFLGVEQRTAMTTTELPLPVEYSNQIVELVFAFGQARQFATILPLGTGSVKLPRLKAGEDAFGYLGVGTAGMSQPVTEKRPSIEHVSFDANKCGGLIRLPTELEEDSFVAVGQFLARYIARQFALLEDSTLFIGDGTATYADQIGVGPYCASNPTYLVKLDDGKTKCTDITVENLRAMRGKVSAAVLGNMAANGQAAAAYYMSPSLEPLLAGFNKYPNHIVFKNENGKPTFDGWPVRWVGIGAVNNDVAQPEKYAAFFGDLSYVYLGERGTVRVEVSKEVFFATDELAMRALERIDVNVMATDAMSALQLGAAVS